MSSLGVILTGGEIDPEFVRSWLETNAPEGAGVIAADRGLAACMELGLKPDAIVGDFDSAGKEILSDWRGREDVILREFVPEKDWTDTEIALEQAIAMGWKEIVIFGAFGTRIDHVMGNLQVLSLAEERGVSCCLLDAHNRLTVRGKSFSIRKEEQWGDYVSLFAFGGDVQGLTLRGFHYEVTDFTLGSVGSRGVSNEITSEEAFVLFRSGKLLVAETRD